MSECPEGACPRDEEVKRLVGELSVLIDFIRQQLALIVTQEVAVA